VAAARGERDRLVHERLGALDVRGVEHLGRHRVVAVEQLAQPLEALVVRADVEVRDAGLAGEQPADVRVEHQLRELRAPAGRGRASRRWRSPRRRRPRR
jgi:uncharacterized protein with von Willebrand factor type A (vWA) domain